MKRIGKLGKCGAAAGACLIGAGVYLLGPAWAEEPGTPFSKQPPAAERPTLLSEDELPRPREIPPFLHKGISWLVEAQHPDGGWGGGSHAQQNLRDPHQVPTDPATTSFAALALLRAGHTPVSGSHQASSRRATEYLVKTVEAASDEGPKITDRTGTQPQAKLGALVDTSLTAQFLARVLQTLPKEDELHARVDKALEKCLKKLQASQKEDGSWDVAGGGGWAPVLQSSLSTSALEVAQAAGKQIDGKVLRRARDYQRGNFDTDTGEVRADKAAGIKLYAFAGAQRANAADARAANELIEQGKREGKLAEEADVSQENLRKLGVAAPQAAALDQAAQQADAQARQLADENLIRGFGNNGGEEYLSYLLTSESLVITGGEQFAKWNGKMRERLAKVQNRDGSWSGHHCITSPVFCTAAVIQCLTADRDASVLLAIAQKATARQPAAAGEAQR